MGIMGIIYIILVILSTLFGNITYNGNNVTNIIVRFVLSIVGVGMLFIVFGLPVLGIMYLLNI